MHSQNVVKRKNEINDVDREGSVQSNHPELMGQNSKGSKVCRVLSNEFGVV